MAENKKRKKIIKYLLFFILFALLFTSIVLIVNLKNKIPGKILESVSEEKKGEVKDAVIFKFPEMINFDVIKDDKNIGSCQLFYQEKTEKEGISYLRMKNFQGFGLHFEEWLASYIYAHDSSLYAGFLLKGNKKIFEVRWKDGLGFDGEKEKVLTYKEEAEPETQIIPFAEYPIIDLLSIIVVTSKKAAAGDIESEKFNLIFGKSTIIVEMSYVGQEIVQFKGSEVSAVIFSINYNNAEMFRLKILKNIEGYCFPFSIVIVNDFIGSGRTFEMRLNKLLKYHER